MHNSKFCFIALKTGSLFRLLQAAKSQISIEMPAKALKFVVKSNASLLEVSQICS